MPYSFYEASLKIYTDAKSSIIDENQANVNEMLEAASTYAQIKEQSTVGSSDYDTIDCRLTSLIDPKTGKDFGDEYRKVIFNNYTHNKWLGQMYQFGDNYWLTTNTNTRLGASASSILRRCNNTLKWYDDSGTLHLVPCVFSRELSSENMKDGSSGVPQIWSTMKIQVQRNSETNSLKLNQRLIFDGFAFQIQQINNHISSTYMEFYLFETQIQVTDDTVNDIVNGKMDIPMSGTETKILPMVNSIYLNDTQVFTVNKYVNGVANTDTFTIVCENVPVTNYELNIIDGNTFSIKNKIPSNNLLLIKCTNNTTSEIVTLSVKLTKSW